MERRSQAALEHLMLLAAIMVIVGVIVYSIYVASTGLGTNVSGQIDNVRENVIIPGLVGMLLG
ncbi:MAG: hypothetical protein QMD10_12635 [Desulfitobacteriaceae bacterium]|nr:hypothetical protein [Desulfitobacteriaceae bacterium]